MTGIKKGLEKLTAEENQRYARHFVLPDFGLEGQLKLKAAKVLVVGAGGLGSPLLLYLAAAGIGHIGIIDDDLVDLSNLQRQVLYSVNDLGKYKVDIAKQKILALNPNIKVEVYRERLNVDNVFRIMEAYDIVADGTDNFATRYLVNDACVLANKINVYASIFRFEGQVAVFNMSKTNGKRGVNYRDLFPEPPDPSSVPNCAEGGVLGVLPGIIGSMQANEVIKIAAGVGAPLSGRLFLFDAAAFSTRVLKIPVNPSLEIKNLEAISIYCDTYERKVRQIKLEDFIQLKESGEEFVLIDVRTAKEYTVANIGAKLIPLDQIAKQTHLIPRERKVILHCKSGQRSATAIRILEKDFGYQNLYNLEGGISAWEAANLPISKGKVEHSEN